MGILQDPIQMPHLVLNPNKEVCPAQDSEKVGFRMGDELLLTSYGGGKRTRPRRREGEKEHVIQGKGNKFLLRYRKGPLRRVLRRIKCAIIKGTAQEKKVSCWEKTSPRSV